MFAESVRDFHYNKLLEPMTLISVIGLNSFKIWFIGLNFVKYLQYLNCNYLPFSQNLDCEYFKLFWILNSKYLKYCKIFKNCKIFWIFQIKNNKNSHFYANNIDLYIFEIFKIFVDICINSIQIAIFKPQRYSQYSK